MFKPCETCDIYLWWLKSLLVMMKKVKFISDDE